MLDGISRKIDLLGPCPKCNSYHKIKGSHYFGYLELKCPDCGWTIVSECRSGSIDYILENEMADRWNNGKDDAADDKQGGSGL